METRLRLFEPIKHKHPLKKMPRQSRPKSRKEITKELTRKIEELCQKYNDRYHLDNDFALLFFVSIKNENDEMRSVSYSNCGDDETIRQCLKSLMDNSAEIALLFNAAVADYNIGQTKIRKELEITL